MRALCHMRMAFSGFFAWLVCASLVSAMQGEFHPGATQQILPLFGVLIATSAICTAADLIQTLPHKENP